MEKMNLFLDCLVSPKSAEMGLFNKQEGSEFAISLFVILHVLKNIAFEVRVGKASVN